MASIENIHHPSYAVENLDFNWEAGECFHFIVQNKNINQDSLNYFSKIIWKIGLQIAHDGKRFLPEKAILKDFYNKNLEICRFYLDSADDPSKISGYFFHLSKIDDEYWLVNIDWHHDWLNYSTFTQLLEVASIFALSFEYEFGFFSNNFGSKKFDVISLLNLAKNKTCFTANVTFFGKDLLSEKEIKKLSLAPLFQFRRIKNGYMAQVEPYSLTMLGYYTEVNKFIRK